MADNIVNKVHDILSKRNKYYRITQDAKTWSHNNDIINDRSNEFINKIAKEIGMAHQNVKMLYGQKYDASMLISYVFTHIDRDKEIRFPVFDIFDDNFRLNSIKVVKQFLIERCQKKSITIVELLQFCVYSQLILMGFRSDDYYGGCFGESENLILEWKKKYNLEKSKIKRKILENRKKEYEQEIRKCNYYVEEEDEDEDTQEVEEPNNVTVDSWEDLV